MIFLVLTISGSNQVRPVAIHRYLADAFSVVVDSMVMTKIISN